MSDRPAPDLPLGHRIGSGRSAEVFLYGPGHVLKLYRTPHEPNAITNEFAAARRAYALGLPVPEPVAILEREGRTGIVFERLHGPVMHAAYIRNPLRYLVGLHRLALLQRDIHDHTAADLPHLREPLRWQIAHARVSDRAKQAAFAVLDSLPRGNRLCHGDLHPDNVIATAAGLWVIDWQKAGLGTPAADAARTALLLRYGSVNLGRIGRFLPLDAVRTLLAELYIGWYCRASGVRRAEIKAWLLPLLVCRLFGQPASNETDVRAAVEKLAKQTSPTRAVCQPHAHVKIDPPEPKPSLAATDDTSVTMDHPSCRTRFLPHMISNRPSTHDRQTALATSFERTGHGLHTGRRARVRVCPAPADHGIVFRRTLKDGRTADVPALATARTSRCARPCDRRTGSWCALWNTCWPR